MTARKLVLTPDDVRQAAERVIGLSHDPEDAHYEEDQLYLLVLTAIAEGTCADAEECARLALTTQCLGTRWYA